MAQGKGEGRSSSVAAGAAEAVRGALPATSTFGRAGPQGHNGPWAALRQPCDNPAQVRTQSSTPMGCGRGAVAVAVRCSSQKHRRKLANPPASPAPKEARSSQKTMQNKSGPTNLRLLVRHQPAVGDGQPAQLAQLARGVNPPIRQDAPSHLQRPARPGGAGAASDHWASRGRGLLLATGPRGGGGGAGAASDYRA